MYRTIQKILGMIFFLCIAISGSVAVTTNARAAGCPYPVLDQTSNDNPLANIRLLSPVLSDENSIHRVGLETQFTIDCDWFGVGLRYNEVYVPSNLSTTLTFNASAPDGSPLVNQVVKLRVNKGYSSSNARVRVNGVTARPAPSNAADGADVFGTTDNNGNVSFIVLPPSDCSVYGGTLPSAPSQLNSNTPFSMTNDPTTDCFTQLLPEIYGEKRDSSQIVELHYFGSPGSVYYSNQVSSQISVPYLDSSNSISIQSKVAYLQQLGSTHNITYSFTNLNGTPARGMPIRISANLPNTIARSNFKIGVFGSADNGGSTTMISQDRSRTNLGMVDIQTSTDGLGLVTLVLQNEDAIGEAFNSQGLPDLNAQEQVFANLSVQPMASGTTLLNPTVLEIHFAQSIPLNGLQAPFNVIASAQNEKVTVSWDQASNQSKLAGNSVVDDLNTVVCTATSGTSCNFDWDWGHDLELRKYRVIPFSNTVIGKVNGPTSAHSAPIRPYFPKPILKVFSPNNTVNGQAEVLLAGYGANSWVSLSSQMEKKLVEVNENGFAFTSMNAFKTGVIAIKATQGKQVASAAIYVPYDLVKSGFCRKGLNIMLSFAGGAPESEVKVSTSQEQVYISKFDSKSKALVYVSCNEVGGFLWNAKVGDINLSSGGVTVR